MIEWQSNSFKRMHGFDYPAQLIWFDVFHPKSQKFRSITVGIMSLGAFLSAFPMSKMADTFGRKRSIIYNNSLVILSCIVMYIAYDQDNYILMIFARFITGFNYGIHLKLFFKPYKCQFSGFNSGLGPTYFTEIAPTNLRGAVGCISQLFVWFGKKSQKSFLNNLVLFQESCSLSWLVFLSSWARRKIGFLFSSCVHWYILYSKLFEAQNNFISVPSNHANKHHGFLRTRVTKIHVHHTRQRCSSGEGFGFVERHRRCEFLQIHIEFSWFFI